MTVITPTIAGRERLLADAVESVQQQTYQANAHLVFLDTGKVGPASARNALLLRVQTPLVAFLDDDDTLDDDHLAALVTRLEAHEADLAWSYCRSVGYHAVNPPRPKSMQQFTQWMQAGRNCVPVTVVARLDAIKAAGCFDPADRYEDYALWMRMLRLGATFTCLRRETWTYRFFGSNRTHI